MEKYYKDTSKLEKLAYNEIEVAIICGLCKRSIEELRKSKCIKAKKIRGRYIYLRKDVEKFLDEWVYV
jgi:hypothetical protein